MTKEELKSYRSVLAEIRQLKEELRLESGGALCARLTGMPGARGKSDPVALSAVQAAALSQLLDGMLSRLICLRGEIEAAVEALEPRDRLLIRKRYIEGKRWEQIALDLGYTYQHVLKLHGRILQKMQRG